MNNDLINSIKEKVNSKFELGGYKLKNTHFENGRNLHSEQYYYAKKIFQNTDNCDEINKLLLLKLKELNLPDSTTLIGFRNYIGLLLNKVTQELGKYNYAIIEHDNFNFIWQHLPILKDNLLIVLPITCTCSTYIKLRKFIVDDVTERFKRKNIHINEHFINIFLILEEAIETLTLPLSINLLEKNNNLYQIYSAFNWVEITENSIIFNNKTKNTFTAHPLVRLYSKLHLPESCELCFPNKDNGWTEKPLFPTHDNFETPNLIFGFPNFTSVNKQQDLFEAFSSYSDKRHCDIHLYGHTVVNENHALVNESHYMNYIRGDQFYEKNKDQILAFFNTELSNQLKTDDKNIIFITAENKHNCNFLEDICLENSLKKKSITILRFEPSNEFIDNFISLHGKAFNQDKLKVIYFEEVISAGKTFKLISDYIKHSRNTYPKVTGRHGFDLVLSLVDRTLLFTRDEIIKKIYSERNKENPEEKFISYFKLNVPIISASHMGNPLIQRNKDLTKMVEQCHLDSLKIYIANEIKKQQPKNIHDLQSFNEKNIDLNYFPFKNLEGKSGNNIYNLYKERFNKTQLDLLKLFLAHQINCELSDPKYQNPEFFKPYENNPEIFIIELITIIKKKIEPNIGNYFVVPKNNQSELRNKIVETEIIEDTIIKTLTRHPFIYYKNIYEAIFAFNLHNLDIHHGEVEKNSIRQFEVFRRLKFYIRRSIELNSNFIISERFIKCLKNQYSKNSINAIMSRYITKKSSLSKELNNEEITKDFFDNAITNIDYKISQVATYFWFLLYCYKELVYKNPYRSIKLEELINSPSLLPYEIANPIDTDEHLEKLVTNPYFHFTGMLKAENIYLLHELKELHKQNLKRPHFKGIANYSQYYFGSSKKHKKHHDPIIINAQKLLKHSRFSHIKNELERGKKINEIKLAIGNMLNTINILESKKIRMVLTDKEIKAKKDLNSEIKEILKSVLTILQPGLRNDSLKFGFFVEFRERNKENKNSNNIYSIFSDENSDNPETITLNRDGLIYNMLYGIYDNQKSKNEQALISALRLGKDKYVSFTDKYSFISFPEGKLTEKPFIELYNNDLYDSKSGSGLKLLEDANMCLMIRFAALSNQYEKENNYSLKGQAVLVITSSEQCNTSNFLNFMSNEKVRLLLLIKEELLEYLQKQFDNDTFNEVLENRKRVIYQKHLRHGLNQYLTAQTELLDKIWKGVNSIENMEVFRIVSDAIRGQLKATKLIDINEHSNINKMIFVEKIKLIVESDILGSRQISFSEVDISELDFEFIELHPTLYDVIIPELIINMKKYSPRINEKGLSIKFEKSTSSLVFKNLINSNLSSEEYGGGEGHIMCNHLLEDILKLQSLKILSNDKEHTIILKIKNHD